MPLRPVAAISHCLAEAQTSIRPMRSFFGPKNFQAPSWEKKRTLLPDLGFLDGRPQGFAHRLYVEGEAIIDFGNYTAWH